jgi:hypothetical protein
MMCLLLWFYFLSNKIWEPKHLTIWSFKAPNHISSVNMVQIYGSYLHVFVNHLEDLCLCEGQGVQFTNFWNSFKLCGLMQ